MHMNIDVNINVDMNIDIDWRHATGTERVLVNLFL